MTEPNIKDCSLLSSAVEYRKTSVILDETTVHDINEVDEDGADK